MREFFAVTLPGLRNELAVAMSLSVITALRAFDIIFVTTKGGPGNATTVPSLLIYQRAFITGEVGSAAAIGAIMGAIILLLSVVITRVVRGAAVNTGSIERTATHVMLALFAVLALAPLVVVVLAAMHPSGTLLSGAGLPDSFSLATFRTAWDEGGFSRLMTSSAIVAVTVVALTTVLSIPAGYAFGTMRFPFADLLFYVILTGIVVPFESLIVPLYYSFRNVGLTDTYWGLILPQTGLSISFGVFWMRAFFRSRPAGAVGCRARGRRHLLADPVAGAGADRAPRHRSPWCCWCSCGRGTSSCWRW